MKASGENCHIKVIVFAFLLTLSGSLVAQNLVNNPSFEEYSQCPSLSNYDISLAVGWYSPTGGTPDYYNACADSSSGFNVPHYQRTGYLHAKSGESYCGLGFFQSHTNYPSREYIQTKLTEKLKRNSRYLCGFYNAVSNRIVDYGYIANIAVNNIGILFTEIDIESQQWILIDSIPQIENDSTNPLINRFSWMLVADTFIATGEEQYITIGNFNDDTHTDTLILDNNSIYLKTYYLIDDVFVIPLDSLTTIKEPKPLQGKAYTAGGQLAVELEESYKPIHLMLTTATGQTVWQHQEFFTQGQRQFYLPPLSAGLYFVEVRCGGGVMREKVLITQE